MPIYSPVSRHDNSLFIILWLTLDNRILKIVYVKKMAFLTYPVS